MAADRPNLLPDWYPDGTPLAIGEVTNAHLWPREFYPSADDALEAQVIHTGPWDYFDEANARVRLVWALPDCFGGRRHEPGWWTWGCRHDPLAVECWEVIG